MIAVQDFFRLPFPFSMIHCTSSFLNPSVITFLIGIKNLSSKDISSVIISACPSISGKNGNYLL